VYENTNQILFTLSCAAVWIGVLNSIQEICKEKVIFKRERAVNLELIPYIASKLLILGVICAIQAVLLVGTFNLFRKFPEGSSFIWNLKLEVAITMFLTLLASTAMGLCVSTLASNTDRAMGIAPILLIPQIMFSGFVFKLSGFSDKLSYLAVSKWSMRGLAISLNINDLPLKLIEENKNKPQVVAVLKQLGRGIEHVYDHNASKLFANWRILLLIVFICIVLSVILINRNTER
jgi:ABC-type multidrug transport system permease subunit